MLKDFDGVLTTMFYMLAPEPMVSIFLPLVQKQAIVSIKNAGFPAFSLLYVPRTPQFLEFTFQVQAHRLRVTDGQLDHSDSAGGQ